MSVITQYHGTTTMKELVKWVNFPRSSYYYKPSNNRKGIPPSTTTTKRDGTEISNNEVVEEIKKIVSGEFVCYGYQNVTSELKDQDFIINHKKVYRLMDENQLLLGKVIKTHGKREFVQFRKITATHPMEFLCWDIKYIWVRWERKNYYLLSIMDIYTRRIIYTTNAIESLNSSIRKYTKTKTVFPDDQAALKSVYLAIANIEKKWTMPVRNWGSVINQLIIKFEDRCGVL